MTTMEIDSSEDSLPEVETRFMPFTSTPADDKENVPLEPDICVCCSLIKSSSALSDLRLLHFEVEMLSCISDCLLYSNPLKFFTEAFCSKLTERNFFDKDKEEIMLNNVKEIFLKYVDHLECGRLKFFSYMLEHLEHIHVSEDKDKVVTFLNKIAHLFVNDNVVEFEDFFGGRAGRAARKSVFGFMSQTSNFLALQAFVESLLIFYKKGVNINQILPDSLSFLSTSFAALPGSKRDPMDYHRAVSSITRKIIREVLHERSIKIFELCEERFMNQLVPSGRDLFLYLSTVDNVLHHLVVFSLKDLYLERIQLKVITLDKKARTLVTDHWIFTFQSEDSVTYLEKISGQVSEHEVQEILMDASESEAHCDQSLHEDLKEKEDVEEYDADADSEGKGEEYYESFVDKGGDSSPSDEDLKEKEDVEAYDAYADSEGKGEEYYESFVDKVGNSNPSDDVDDVMEDIINAEIATGFTVAKADIKDYWDPDRRIFSRGPTGRDWPMMYGSPCAVVIGYNRPKVFKSRKRKGSFAKLTGHCIICNSLHHYDIEASPFHETLQPDGSVMYVAVSDMFIFVTVQGEFHSKEGQRGEPNIKKPVHRREHTKGLDLRGEERRLLGTKASLEGAYSVYKEGMAYRQRDQIENCNRSSVRSLPVIRGAMAEEEKKKHAGDDFEKSIRNVMDAQKSDFSKNFPKSKKLPGIVRSLQEKPFKMMLGNYDQLRLGAEYLNKTENSFICLDSSGKFWADREKKNAPKKLNSALVIPPIQKGQSPFPIFEQISESNKTIDFINFLQYAFHFMGISISNQEVKKPAILISDLSFANIHAVLDVFNKMKIKEYLKKSFQSLTKKEKVPFDTVLTICESHLLPAILKSVRAANTNKVLADTLTAGVLVMLRAQDFETAYEVWKNLVKVHGSKVPDKVAQDSVKHYSMNDVDPVEDAVGDFSDDDDEEEVVKYGKREAIRANSPFFHLFKRPLDKLLNEEENINSVTNPFYCPDLLLLICKQYLALFPLISASVLPGENLGLRNNAYVELYWQELRRIFASIPKRQLWPPQYLGMLHEDIQRKATEIVLKKFIPNLRTGGKVRQKAVTFADTLGDDDNLHMGGRPGTKSTELFKPKPSKKKKAGKPKESFNESFETWAKKERGAVKRKSSNYMKGKVIDYASIEDDNFSVKRKNVVTGPVAAKGQVPQIINISEAEVGAILTKNYNIDTEALDAGLSLIDRKLSEDCHYVEGVTVYNITTIRLILTGEDYWVQDGQFLAIFPRRFALEEEAELAFGGQGEKREVYIGHFTLVSNIRCEEGEVRVYETLPAYRNPKTLLTEEQKKLLKKLAKIKDEKLLRVDCVDVCPQREQECGAISFGLAVQLCFTFPEEKSLFASFVDVRRDFVKCLRANDVVMFETLKRDVSSDVLFSIDI